MSKIIRTIGAATFALGITLIGKPADAVVTVTAIEAGGDVVFNATGTYDVTGLSFLTSANFDGRVLPSEAVLFMGEISSGSEMDFYQGLTASPTDFGSGALTGTNNSSGDTFSGDGFGFTFVLFSGLPVIGIPSGALQTGSITSQLVFANSTFASLGLTEGTYDWTWSTDSARLTIGGTTAVPLPAAVWLLLSATGGLFGVGWLGRRRTNA
ncbi:MAG: VPLPA-CTERM sorting domain-containing protein [Paracoccaceae bacterium]